MQVQPSLADDESCVNAVLDGSWVDISLVAVKACFQHLYQEVAHVARAIIPQRLNRLEVGLGYGEERDRIRAAVCLLEVPERDAVRERPDNPVTTLRAVTRRSCAAPVPGELTKAQRLIASIVLQLTRVAHSGRDSRDKRGCGRDDSGGRWGGRRGSRRVRPKRFAFTFEILAATEVLSTLCIALATLMWIELSAPVVLAGVV